MLKIVKENMNKLGNYSLDGKENYSQKIQKTDIISQYNEKKITLEKIKFIMLVF